MGWCRSVHNVTKHQKKKTKKKKWKQTCFKGVTYPNFSVLADFFFFFLIIFPKSCISLFFDQNLKKLELESRSTISHTAVVCYGTIGHWAQIEGFKLPQSKHECSKTMLRSQYLHVTHMLYNAPWLFWPQPKSEYSILTPLVDEIRQV